MCDDDPFHDIFERKLFLNKVPCRNPNLFIKDKLHIKAFPKFYVIIKDVRFRKVTLNFDIINDLSLTLVMSLKKVNSLRSIHNSYLTKHILALM